MKVYNTLTRQKETFVPLHEGKVDMYVCGPTVYDYIHIGNARPLVVFDTLHRYLKYRGNEVNYVVNFTDIDDKIINRAVEEGVDFHEVSHKYIDAFNESAKALNLLEKETIHPRATEMVEEMIAFISGLVEKGAAYDAEDSVYFDISKASNYGKLSKKNIDDLQSGARVDVNVKKKNPMDFALWKKQKTADEPAWPSPWGPGRPGWHIECSVMSKEILGETIDIHAGGEDLQFPHHENEIAQSETLHDETFARYWMHNSMINVKSDDGVDHKMSKSLGNFFTLKDIEKEYDLIIVRMWLLSVHYRSPISFSRESMEQTKAGYQRLMNAKETMERLLENNAEGDLTEDHVKVIEEAETLRKAFVEKMDDDLNTADALTQVFELSRLTNGSLDENSPKQLVQTLYDTFMELTDVLGIEDRKEDASLDAEIEQLIEERNEARKSKNFQRADEIRDALKARGIVLKDTPTGVVWTKE